MGKKVGICKLTGEYSHFVKSHIIPKSLTKPEKPGEHFLEPAPARPMMKRFSSWYDDELVSRKGEDYLSKIDSDAVSEFKKHKLIWSSWVNKKPDFKDFKRFNKDKGFRLISSLDDYKIRIFVLSVIWRALSSNKREMSHLENIGVDLDEIANHIVLRKHLDPLQYPIVLHQISNIGEIHNATPTISEQEFDLYPPLPKAIIKSYRLYFDGLVIHFYPKFTKKFLESASFMNIGIRDKTFVLTHTYESSAQKERLEFFIESTYREFE